MLLERKRKLVGLPCVPRLPLLPISNDQVVQSEDKLMRFFQRNDLAKSQDLEISTLHSDKLRKLVSESLNYLV